jgi:hypothetical protein
LHPSPRRPLELLVIVLTRRGIRYRETRDSDISVAIRVRDTLGDSQLTYAGRLVQ